MPSGVLNRSVLTSAEAPSSISARRRGTPSA
jgi:hypothetical protein